MRHSAWLALLLSVAAVGGTAYRSVGPDGTVTYTDRPAPNAEEVRLPEPSVFTPPALPASGTAPAFGAEPLAADLYTTVRITTPPDGGTLFAAQGGVDVDVLLEPSLMEGHTLSYIVDGKEMAKGLRANRIRITDLDRGAHHLEVAVRDESGGIVGRSGRITFHLRQSSLNDPLRDKDDNDKPDKDPSYKPPADKPPYTPPATTTPPYVPPASTRPPYQPPSTTSPYAPPAKPPSYVPPPPARPPYAPSYTPK